jgi:hypothetical protein
MSGGRRRPPFGTRANASIDRSMSAARSTGAGNLDSERSPPALGRTHEIIKDRTLGVCHQGSARDTRCYLLEHRGLVPNCAW